MSANVLLSRLDMVRKSGAGRWTSRCPAHDDKGPSLAVRELDDGRVLVHCFAGCHTTDVLTSVGLTFEDLFPERLTDINMPKERRPFMPGDVLRALAFEALVIYHCAKAIADGNTLSNEDQVRLLEAVSRFQHGVEAANA